MANDFTETVNGDVFSFTSFLQVMKSQYLFLTATGLSSFLEELIKARTIG